MLAARAADLWSTHALDPTLAGEQNLAHAMLGVGFFGLVGINLLVLAGLSFLFVRSLRLTSGLAPSKPGLGLGPFLSHFLLGGAGPWYQILWRTPSRPRARWLLGRMVVAPTLAVSVLAFAGNFLSYQSLGFAAVWAALVGNPVGLLLTLGACIALALAAWLLAEYGLYRRRATGSAAGRLVAEAESLLVARAPFLPHGRHPVRGRA